MSFKSLGAAFCLAASLAGPQAYAQSVAVGRILPRAEAEQNLAAGHWSPIAMGEIIASPELSSSGQATQWMMVLHQKGTDNVRIARLNSGIMQVLGEGEAVSFQPLMKPYINVSQADNKCVKGFEAEYRLQKMGQGPVIQFRTEANTLITVNAGENADNTWSVTSQKKGSDMVCLLMVGNHFGLDLSVTAAPEAGTATPAPKHG